MDVGLSLRRYAIHQPIKDVKNVHAIITFLLKRVCGIVAVVGETRDATQHKCVSTLMIKLRLLSGSLWTNKA